MWNNLPEVVQNILGIGAVVLFILALFLIVVRFGGTENNQPKGVKIEKDPFGVTQNAVGKVQEELDIFKMRKHRRSSVKEAVDKGEYDTPIFTAEQIEFFRFMGITIGIVIVLVILFLYFGGFLKGKPKIKSGEVVPMGQTVVLQSETSLQDLAKIPQYNIMSVPGPHLQQFICNEDMAIPINTPGHVILSNVSGIKVKVKTPEIFSFVEPLKITCSQPGIMLIAFFPE